MNNIAIPIHAAIENMTMGNHKAALDGLSELLKSLSLPTEPAKEYEDADVIRGILWKHSDSADEPESHWIDSSRFEEVISAIIASRTLSAGKGEGMVRADRIKDAYDYHIKECDMNNIEPDDIFVFFEKYLSQSPTPSTSTDAGSGLKEIEIEMPIGDFILSQKDIPAINGANGAYYHYSDVCKLLNRLKKSIPSDAGPSTDNLKQFLIDTVGTAKATIIISAVKQLVNKTHSSGSEMFTREQMEGLADVAYNAGIIEDREELDKLLNSLNQ